MNDATDTRKDIQTQMDEAILETIKDSRAAREPMPAAFIKAITERYKDVQPMTVTGSTRDQIIHNLRIAGSGKLPPLDQETDDAATA